MTTAFCLLTLLAIGDLPASSESTPATTGLRDIAPIEEIPQAPSLWPWLAWPVGLAIAIVAALWLRRAWRRTGMRKPLSAADRARWEIERIRRLRPAPARLHRMLSNVLRSYLLRRFSIDARRRTTFELQQEIDKMEALSEDQKRSLCRFLGDCDMVNFAAAAPSAQECAKRIDWLADFVLRERGQVNPPLS